VNILVSAVYHTGFNDVEKWISTLNPSGT